MLAEIVAELSKVPEAHERVPLAQVERWMGSSDLETLGATAAFLSNPSQVARITPSVSFDAAFDFFSRYYEQCLVLNKEGEWAHSAYGAGWDMVSWFVSLWDRGTAEIYFERIKSQLARLYVSASPWLKTCIEHSIIEHLFERQPIRRFFSDWKDNPQLRPAYEEGLLWVNNGGWSPLTRE